MATDAQLRANRLNSLRSTGPRTPEGRERSKFNALKHGLSSKFVILPGEEEHCYLEHRGEFFRQYQPQNPAEAFLVDQIAQNSWRLNRARRFETGTLSGLHPDSETPYPEPDTIDQLRRYEASIERSFYRALDRMEKIVRRRPYPIEPDEELDSEPAPRPAPATEAPTQPVTTEPLDPIGFVSQPGEPPLADLQTPEIQLRQ